MAELAIVTGANRGLGLEVVWQLAQRGLSVVLTGRDRTCTEHEAARLRERSFDVTARALDVTDTASIEAFVEWLGEREVNVFVSNAGIALKGFDEDVVARTLATNYRAATHMVDVMAPRLVRGSRVVLVSSGLGQLSNFSAKVRAHFDPPESREAIDAAVADFESLVHLGKHEANGWPSSAYNVSKAALNAWTRLAADELRPRGILVNAVCPGWVRTRMGGTRAPRGVTEGAECIVWAATLPPDGPTGCYFIEGHAHAW